MIPFLNKISSDLEDQLHFISLETDDILRKSELSIQSIQIALAQLKEFIYKYKFKNQSEEIKFFKEQKPEIFSKLSYHVKVYNIEMHKPNGSDKAKKRYLQNELNNIENYFNRNLEFIKYYRTKKTYLDHKYFIRGKHDLSLTLDTFYFETDPKFSTSHDYKVSKIISNQLLEIYLITIEPTKTMIGISNAHKRIAWVTQLGKNFIHVVFPFKHLNEDNLCFQKMGQVPWSTTQYNHHLRIYFKEDVNTEVLKFMKMAYKEEQ